MNKKIFLLGLLFIFSTLAKAGPTIGVFLDNTIVSSESETFPSFWVSGQGGSQPVVADVHVALVSPSGEIYEFPNWNTKLKPWLPHFTIRSGLKVNPIRLSDLGKLPFQLTPGAWRLAGALTKPGTLEFISLDIQSFFVSPPASSDGKNLRIGSISASAIKSASGGTLGIPVNVSTNKSVSGSFLEICINPDLKKVSSEELSDLARDQKIDECRIIKVDSNIPSVEPTPPACETSFLDAGPQLTFASSKAGSVPVPQDANSASLGLLTYRTDLPESFFQSEATYTLSGPGGPDVGPFKTRLRIAPLSVTSPNLLSGTATLNPNAPLEVRWNGQGGQGDVMVMLTAVSINVDPNSPGDSSSTTRILRCRFADDGNGTVPGNLISEFSQGLGGGFLTPTITMSVDRQRTAFFSTGDNSLDYGIFTLSTGESGPLQLQ